MYNYVGLDSLKGAIPEKKRRSRGGSVIVKVKPVEIPNNTIVYPLSTIRHAYVR